MRANVARIEPNNDSPIGSGHETRTKRRDVGESSYSGREKLPRLCSEGRGAGGTGRGSTPPTPPPDKHLVITIRSESMKKSEDVQLRIKGTSRSVSTWITTIASTPSPRIKHECFMLVPGSLCPKKPPMNSS